VNTMESNLPNLTKGQQNFLLRYFHPDNGKNASEAYRYAFNASKMKGNTVWKEASKLLNNPKVTPWVKYYEANQAEVMKDEINYSARDCFNELNNLLEIALEEQGKYKEPNLSAASKIIELKGRIGGAFKEDNDQQKEQTTINIVRPT